MQTGWVWSAAWQGGYYLYTSGAKAGQMAVSTWIDDVYYVGSDGKMYKGGVFTVDGDTHLIIVAQLLDINIKNLLTLFRG